MQFMSTWCAYPGAVPEFVDRFLAGGAGPVEGVKMLGRWHKADCSGGFTLYETDNPDALYKSAALWAEVLDIQTVPVIGDSASGPILQAIFRK
jgi:hypothetical protein